MRNATVGGIVAHPYMFVCISRARRYIGGSVTGFVYALYALKFIVLVYRDKIPHSLFKCAMQLCVFVCMYEYMKICVRVYFSPTRLLHRISTFLT